jgi:hypothetical protein
MALLWRVKVTWTGGKVGTGFTNLFFTEGVGTAQQAADASRALFTGVYGATGTTLPTGIALTFPTQVDILEPGTGILLDAIPVTAGSPIAGSDATAYAAPAGMCITWRTTGVVNGQRVQGRTFFVPLGGSGLQNDGTPSAVMISAANTSGATLIAAAPEFAVWHRPESVAAGGGASFPVVSLNVRDTAAVLTSRR